MRVEKVASGATQQPEAGSKPKRSGGPRKNRYTAAEFADMGAQTRSLDPKEAARRVHLARQRVDEDENLTRNDVTVFGRLIGHLNRERHGFAFPKQSTLASGMGKDRRKISPRTIPDSLKRLEDGGHVAIERRRARGTQANSRVYFPNIAFGANTRRGSGANCNPDCNPDCKPDCNSDCGPDCNWLQSADCNLSQSADCSRLQSEEELAPTVNLLHVNSLPQPPADAVGHGEGGGRKSSAQKWADQLLADGVNGHVVELLIVRMLSSLTVEHDDPMALLRDIRDNPAIADLPDAGLARLAKLLKAERKKLVSSKDVTDLITKAMSGLKRPRFWEGDPRFDAWVERFSGGLPKIVEMYRSQGFVDALDEWPRGWKGKGR